MDAFGIGDTLWDLGGAGLVAARQAMGHTRKYADNVNLAALIPKDSLSTTGYCLANPGSEYLVYQPASGPFTVDVVAGTYRYEWFNAAAGAMEANGSVTLPGGSESFAPPFSGDAVLYLKSSSSPLHQQP
jgi:hypothetical protein